MKTALWPGQGERALLSRFYLAGGMTQALNLVEPFVFAYLLLVMERPEWAVLPFLAASLAGMVTEVPTGVLADRWGRKRAVLTGYGLSAAAWASVPFAVSFDGTNQLLAVSAAFVVDALGETLVSGAEEAWVVDNLSASDRGDLVGLYFGRRWSFDAVGGILASGLVLVILLSVSVDRLLLDVLWYAAALGQMIGIVVVARVPELQPGAPRGPSPSFWTTLRQGARQVWSAPALRWFMVAFLIAAIAGSAVDDAFVMSMITKGFDARGLAPLYLVGNAFGIVAPLIAIPAARRLGRARFLALFLVLPALAVMVLLVAPVLWVVVLLAVCLDFMDDLWDPIAQAHLQAMIPSAERATIGSMANLVATVAEFIGIGLFALLIASRSTELAEAIPDLVEAFSGNAETFDAVTAGPFGLDLPDFAILMFIGSGVLGVPFLLMKGTPERPGPRHRRRARVVRPF